MISDPLFQGERIRLTGLDLETDPKTEARWTRDLDYARQLRDKPVRPLTPGELKKLHEETYQEAQKSGTIFHFALRPIDSDQLIGFVRISAIEWTHAAARLELAIAEPIADRTTMIAEALRLALRYAFCELNLHRLSAVLPEYETETASVFEHAGFSLEVRRRALFFRANRYWDAFHYGILRAEWEVLEEAAL